MKESGYRLLTCGYMKFAGYLAQRIIECTEIHSTCLYIIIMSYLALAHFLSARALREATETTGGT